MKFIDIKQKIQKFKSTKPVLNGKAPKPALYIISRMHHYFLTIIPYLQFKLKLVPMYYYCNASLSINNYSSQSVNFFIVNKKYASDDMSYIFQREFWYM